MEKLKELTENCWRFEIHWCGLYRDDPYEIRVWPTTQCSQKILQSGATIEEVIEKAVAGLSQARTEGRS